MSNIFKQKFGISIGLVVKDRMGIFMENGINYMEFRFDKTPDLEFGRNFVKEVKEEKEKYGFITRTCHLPFPEGYDLSVTDEDIRKQAVENQKEIVEIAMELNPEVLVLHNSRGPVAEQDRPKRRAALVKSLKEFAPWCKERGLKIALENLIPGSLLMSSDDLVGVIEEVGCDNIGICFDVNHLFAEPHYDFIKKAGKHIITMHISDNDGIQERHFVPGDGVLDWHLIFSEMDKIGYDGTMICELGSILSGFPDSVPVLKNKLLDVTTR